MKRLNVPVVAVVDLDILADVNQFLRLYCSLGGREGDIKADAIVVQNHVQASKNQTSGRQFKSELDVIVPKLQDAMPVPTKELNAISALVKQASPWTRLKENGTKALTDAAAVQAFQRTNKHCLAVGLIVNSEGELEGFCRSIPRTRKGEWLAEVLKRDIKTDGELKDAREFLATLRHVCVQAVG